LTVANLLACSLVAMTAGCTGDIVDEDDPDNVDPPAEVTGMVSTPNGLVHQSCIQELGEDDTIDDDGNVTRPDGSTYQLPTCDYQTLPHKDVVTKLREERRDDDDEATDVSKEVVPDDNGWIEAAWWHSTHWMKTFHGRFGVPHNPSRAGSQTIFLFPSFEPGTGNAIIQPVLQWGGGKYWAIASWYVGPGRVAHGPLKRVKVGDTLSGAMTSSKCTSSGHCTWKVVTKDLTHAASSTINIKTKVPYTEVQGGVLESYGVNSCSEYPSNGTEGFHDMSFANHLGTVHPKFKKFYWRTTCKEKIVSSPSLVFLNWN
jgi:hypothetical protein